MLAEVITPALAAAVWPPALLFLAFLLGTSNPRKRALVYLAGAIVVTLGFGFVAVVFLQGVGLSRGAHPVAHAWIDVVLGVLLLVCAAVLARYPRLLSSATPRERRELGVLALFVTGMAMYSPSPFYLASLHAITKADLNGVEIAFSVIIVAAIYMSMIEIPIVLYLVWPQRTTRWLDSWNRQLSRHGRKIMIVAAILIGAYLLVSGIIQLAG